MTSVVVVATPLDTAAPCTGRPFSSTTLPCRLAVTILSGGILLLLVVLELLLPEFLLQAINTTRQATNKVRLRVNRVFFRGYRLG